MENLGIELEKTSEDYRSQGMSPTTTIWDDDIPIKCPLNEKMRFFNF